MARCSPVARYLAKAALVALPKRYRKRTTRAVSPGAASGGSATRTTHEMQRATRTTQETRREHRTRTTQEIPHSTITTPETLMTGLAFFALDGSKMSRYTQ